ncbi:MAG: class I SAM-dependent methyltransferase [Rickettsiales bacterium]|jgi:hypothetical protein|nr:class I SAM-dependent methyltransferase [Rickettsiales bacterium]
MIDPRIEQMFTPGLLEEYDILKIALTYYDELEASCQKPISEYVAKNPNQSDYKVIEAGFGTFITTNNILAAGDKISVYAFDPDIGMFKNAIRTFLEWKNKSGGFTKVGTNERDLIDLADSDIDFAKTKCVAYFDRNSFMKVIVFCDKIQDGLKLYSDGYFDGFASGFMLHNLTPEQRTDIFPYISKVIKSGGFYVNVDKYAVDDDAKHKEEYNAEIVLLDKLEQNGYPQVKQEWIDHYEKDDTIKFTHAEQQKLLSDNGFSEPINLFKELLSETFSATKK